MRKNSFCDSGWKVKNEEVPQSKAQENFVIEKTFLTNTNFSQALMKKIFIKKLSEDQK